jgi:hypothetical protein
MDTVLLLLLLLCCCCCCEEEKGKRPLLSPSPERTGRQTNQAPGQLLWPPPRSLPGTQSERTPHTHTRTHGKCGKWKTNERAPHCTRLNQCGEGGGCSPRTEHVAAATNQGPRWREKHKNPSEPMGCERMSDASDVSCSRWSSRWRRDFLFWMGDRTVWDAHSEGNHPWWGGTQLAGLAAGGGGKSWGQLEGREDTQCGELSAPP